MLFPLKLILTNKYYNKLLALKCEPERTLYFNMFVDLLGKAL